MGIRCDDLPDAGRHVRTGIARKTGRNDTLSVPRNTAAVTSLLYNFMQTSCTSRHQEDEPFAMQTLYVSHGEAHSRRFNLAAQTLKRLTRVHPS